MANRASHSSTVAVIGLGCVGLVSLKNLLDEGFQVTGYERNSYIGGIWKYNNGPHLSALESTVLNISRERSCFTDFPFPDDADPFPTAEQTQKYLEDYAAHFWLWDHIQLNTEVNGIRRDENLNKWEIQLTKSDGQKTTEHYDKLVMATGINQIPSWPKIPGIDGFQGDVIHSISYKGPDEFTKKRCLVVGFGNTAADVATSLVGYAREVYIAHRHGAFVMPRFTNGKPFDHKYTRRTEMLMGYLQIKLPRLADKILTDGMRRVQEASFGNVDPEWRLTQEVSPWQSNPIISDDLVPALRAGQVSSVSGLKQVVDGNTVELNDGSRLEVDSIITKKWYEAAYNNGKPLPRLYQNIFSLDYPESLVFMGAMRFMIPVFQAYDLASMAVAQIWKGNSKLPPREEMVRQVDKHHQWVCRLASKSVYPTIVKSYEWMKWVNDAAGTGINENLGYGVRGWWFWLRNRALCKTLMSGIYSPHSFRLFETGKRKAWPGALEAINSLNH